MHFFVQRVARLYDARARDEANDARAALKESVLPTCFG